MAQLTRTAAYVRKRPTGSRQTDSEPVSKVAREIWQHLATPQTLDSLTSAVAQELDVGRSNVATEVETALRRLLDEDLIELSPDS